MSKYASKIGKVGKKALISVQSDMRKNRIDSMISKDNLTKKETRLVGASSILKNSPSAGGKLGKFGLKNQRISGQLGSFNSSNTPTNINEALNTNSNVSIKSFITDPQSKTGVLSQKDVSKGVDNFMSTLRGAAGVKDLNINKSGNRVSNIDVFADYRKTELSFNPKNLSFSTKGWQLDIPDEFKKVGDNKFVAPETQFVDKKTYKREDGNKTENYDYSTYNPVEIVLQDGGNKIKQILKKNVYKKTYDFKEGSNRDRQYLNDYETYVSEKQDFYDTGLLKSVDTWGDYSASKSEKEVNDKTNKDEERLIYKKSEDIFSDKGLKKSQKTWGTFTYDYDKKKRDDYLKEEEKNKAFLKTNIDYDDYGLKSRERLYDDYRTRKEKEYGYTSKTEEDRDSYLKNDIYYAGGKKTAELTYDDFLTGYDTGSGSSFVGYNDEGVAKQLRSQHYYTYGGHEKELDNYDDIQGTKSESEEFEYKIGLRNIRYYDPLTGKIIEEERYN